MAYKQKTKSFKKGYKKGYEEGRIKGKFGYALAKSIQKRGLLGTLRYAGVI